MDDDVITASVSDEARRRIDTARVRQIAFQVKNIAPTLPDEDAETLATVLLEASTEGVTPSGVELRRRLETTAGLSANDAERIASAVGL